MTKKSRMKHEDKLHPSHVTRFSDASSFDEICINCGATDALGTWGKLALPCRNPAKEKPLKPKLKINRDALRKVFNGSGYDLTRISDRKGKFYATVVWKYSLTNGDQPRHAATKLLRTIWKYSIMTSGGVGQGTWRLNPDCASTKTLIDQGIL